MYTEFTDVIFHKKVCIMKCVHQEIYSSIHIIHKKGNRLMLALCAENIMFYAIEILNFLIKKKERKKKGGRPLPTANSLERGKNTQRA